MPTSLSPHTPSLLLFACGLILWVSGLQHWTQMQQAEMLEKAQKIQVDRKQAFAEAKQHFSEPNNDIDNTLCTPTSLPGLPDVLQAEQCVFSSIYRHEALAYHDWQTRFPLENPARVSETCTFERLADGMIGLRCEISQITPRP